MNLLSLGAFDVSSFCSSTKDIIQLIGGIILIFKIAIPIIIVALGIFDFGKAVVAEKEDEIKKQTKRLLMRVVAGIVIFLIPSIIFYIFETFARGYADDASSFQSCKDCFLSPLTKCN